MAGADLASFPLHPADGVPRAVGGDEICRSPPARSALSCGTVHPSTVQNDLYQQVVGATRDQYAVLAELGHAPQHGTAYLAHDLAGGGAVLLLVPPGAESVDVIPALGEAVPATGGRCTACGAAPAAWTDACARCTRSLAPPAPGPGPDAPEVTPERVAAEAGRAVEMLGAVPHARGGQLYFGRDRADRRLVAYAARPHGTDGLWLEPLWEGEAVAARSSAAPSPDTPAAAAPPPAAPTELAGHTPPLRRGFRALLPGRLGALVGLGGAAGALARGA